ncbi:MULTISPECIES: PTS sugar transporter subunit IIA [Pseudomonas]|uniref:PTS sugar transporter subunit IIA n=1 Tax=Pseudomonas TaxID=286 RepID=UPI0002F57542|nr:MULTISPECIES: PTS sugar transporter subunit IIA [Pseudomonas]MDF2395965.1 PTS transporter subunit EIIA [Pseudomonas sp. 3MA1]MDP9525966.1 PTS sugar transporter subunit IIA [Pseudomonas protegens]RBJ82331.1 PTS sugar transporter subunit IIA [Pseudomonas sp. MWU12-2534b]
MSKLARYLQVEDILLAVNVSNKQRLFEQVGRHLQETRQLPGDAVTASLWRRELAASTAIGDGVALPHARLAELDGIHALYLRPQSAIAFAAPDQQPVSDILVLLVPAPADQQHLDLLADTARLFSNPRFRQALLRCKDGVQVKQLFDHW